MLGRVLLIGSGLFVVLLIAALLAPYLVDRSVVRNVLEKQISGLMQSPVTIRGAIDFQLLPFPSLKLAEVRVGADTPRNLRLEVSQLSMRMEIGPLLSGEARIFDLRLNRPKLFLPIDGTGIRNLGQTPSFAGRTGQIVIEDIHVENGEMHLIDARSGQVRSARDISAVVAAASMQGPWRGEGRGLFEGREGSFSFLSGRANQPREDIPLRVRFRPQSHPVDVQLDGHLVHEEARLAYRGNFSIVSASSNSQGAISEASDWSSWHVKGAFEVTGEQLLIPSYRLETKGRPLPYAVTGRAKLDLGAQPAFVLTAEGQQIDLKRLGRWNDRAGPEDPLQETALRQLEHLVAKLAMIPFPQMPGRVTLRLPVIALKDAMLQDLHLDMEPRPFGTKVTRLDVILPGRTRLQASGDMTFNEVPAFEGTVSVMSEDASGLSRWLVGPAVAGPDLQTPAQLTTKATITPFIQRFDGLDVNIGATRIAGLVERRTPDELASSLHISLKGAHIDLDATQAYVASLLQSQTVTHVLEGHGITVPLRMSPVAASGLVADIAEADVSVADGIVTVERLALHNVAGADLAGHARFDAGFSGEGEVKFASPDPTAFLRMASDRLRAIPLLNWLAGNSQWYRDTELNAEFHRSRSTGGHAIRIEGKSNGSTVTADVVLPMRMDDANNGGSAVAATISNPSGATLLAQTGLTSAAMVAPGPATLTVKAGMRDAAVDATVDLATKTTSVGISGLFEIAGHEIWTNKARLSLMSEDIGSVIDQARMETPTLPEGTAVELLADIAIDTDLLRLDSIEGRLAGVGVRGWLTIASHVTPPAISGSLSFEEINISRLGDIILQPRQRSEGRKAVTEASFPGLAGRVEVTSESVFAGSLGTARKASAQVYLDRNGITLKELTALWRDGQIGGQLALSKAGGLGLLQMQIRGKDIAMAPLPDATGREIASDGKLTFSFTADAVGNNQDQMLRSASGDGSLDIRNLRLTGYEPRDLSRLLSKMESISIATTPLEAENKIHALLTSGDTRRSFPLPPISLSVSLAGGRIRLDGTGREADRLHVSLAGTADVADRQLDARLSLAYIPPPLSLVPEGPIIACRLSGGADGLTLSIDESGLTRYLRQHTAEHTRREVEALQAGLQEKQRLQREIMLFRLEHAPSADVPEKVRDKEQEHSAPAPDTGSAAPKPEMPPQTRPAARQTDAIRSPAMSMSPVPPAADLHDRHRYSAPPDTAKPEQPEEQQAPPSPSGATPEPDAVELMIQSILAEENRQRKAKQDQ
ncbi:AsmA family protein [Rhizobium sp. CSW-27]|uniref:AsmA family protein n=1 Tax=Rhizobium sp. CSW-27 TaxID=2839985 RepID=UPI001C0219C9|nr:AsmA family protein [Rhizobium sp. CSW-27]MBT9373088.1 AsmA family protein [Rhizobium sp. CSW-27]